MKLLKLIEKNIIEICLTILIPSIILITKFLFKEEIVNFVLEIIIGAIYSFYLIHAYFPPKIWRKMWRPIRRASNVSKEHIILNKRLEQIMSDFKHNLGSITQRHFSMRVSEVPKISIYALEQADEECKLIFPVNNDDDLLAEDNPSSRDYYQAVVATSQKLKSLGKEGVTRYFLINKNQGLSMKLFQFIEKNIEDGIIVKIVDKDKLGDDWKKLDFGYFRTANNTAWITKISDTSIHNEKKYDLYTSETAVKDQLAVIAFLEEKQISYEQFFNELIKPINQLSWEQYISDHSFEIPAPNSLYVEDADLIINLALKNIPPLDANILILGRTPKLIRQLLKNFQPKGIVSLDQTNLRLSEMGKVFPSVNFKTGNWLNYQFDEKFDAILFDESLNNLTPLQLSVLLKNITRDYLKPRGRLVGRVFGYDKDIYEQYKNITINDAVLMLKAKQGKSQEQIDGLKMCLMHSNLISFDEKTSMVDFNKWNNAFHAENAAGRITKTEYKTWSFDNRLFLYSPDFEIIDNNVRLYPFNVEYEKLLGNYFHESKDFFKIFSLELIPEKNT